MDFEVLCDIDYFILIFLYWEYCRMLIKGKDDSSIENRNIWCFVLFLMLVVSKGLFDGNLLGEGGFGGRGRGRGR